MKLTAQYETDTVLFPEWPEETMLVIEFDYEPEVAESGQYKMPENYDPGSCAEVHIDSIEIIGDEWFAGKNIKDMMNVKQAKELEEVCAEHARNYLQELGEPNEY